jgi:hypothetical protein
MLVIEIDVVGLEALKGALDRLPDALRLAVLSLLAVNQP